jgi:hypothetical protein
MAKRPFPSDIAFIVSIPYDDQTIDMRHKMYKWAERTAYNQRCNQSNYDPDPLLKPKGWSNGYYAIMRGDGSIMYPDHCRLIRYEKNHRNTLKRIEEYHNRMGEVRVFHRAPPEIENDVLLHSNEATAQRKVAINSTRQKQIAWSLIRYRDFTVPSVYYNAMTVLAYVLLHDPGARVVFGSLELSFGPGTLKRYPYGMPDRTTPEEFYRDAPFQVDSNYK